jgi:translation initiation factor IF-2
MAEVTVSQFAEVLKVPVERLMTQLDEAGIKVAGVDDVISDDAKMELLTHLRRAHGREDEVASPRKITLKRKSREEIKVPAMQGRSRVVNVEVKRKKTYLNREVLQEEARQKQEELDRQRQAEEEKQLEAQRREEALREKERHEQELVEQEARQKADAEARQAADELARKQAEERERAERERAEAERQLREAAPRAAKPVRSAEPSSDQRKGTKYGRRELHVTQSATARAKRRQGSGRVRRQVQVNVDSEHGGFQAPTEPVRRDVQIPETIQVGELASRMAIKANEVIKTMMKMGVMATINQPIDQDTAILVVEECGHNPIRLDEDSVEQGFAATADTDFEMLPRPPVVTIMGHVDHGKTSLLDYIRRTKVAAREAGGITQHIGAYQVDTPKGPITFIDTPGHAAFTSMRARGAHVTDIVVLVVAADDGVMPQTIEAIQHARAAEVPMVVAVNKIDKSDADPDRVRNDLGKYEVIPEEWGGDTLFVNVSAHTGEGIDKLLESILLQSEMLSLQAPVEGAASGVVLESSIEKGRGAVATVLIKRGTLTTGDPIVAGQEFGRVRAMFDAKGEQVRTAGPSTPVQVLGLSNAPNAGDDLLVAENERRAREVALHRQGKFRDVRLAKEAKKAEDVFTRMGEESAESVSLIVKADVQGSAEALRDALTNLSTDEVTVKVIASGVGGITESDVTLAAASKARVIGFNVRADAAARAALKDGGVDVRYYSIIYEAIDDVKQAMTGLLKPEVKEEIVGLAEVREVFRASQFGTVAGCLVTEGVIKRGNPVRVLRDNVVIHQGELDSLRRFKDDVNEVRAGTECGIGVRNYNDIRENDQIECYSRFEVARSV